MHLIPQFIRQAWRTVALFRLTEGVTDHTVVMVPELLADSDGHTSVAPGVPAATGNAQYPAHGFNAKLSLEFYDKDILHFRRFAKYVAAFWISFQLTEKRTYQE